MRADSDVIQRLDRADPLIAVVGATDAPGKYGGVIYRHMKAKGYRVVGVNPGRDTVDGDKAYHSLAKLPEEPDIVNVVIPPAKTLDVIDEVAGFADSAIWIQPGAGDDAVRERLDAVDIPSIIDACIMVVSRQRT
jgi:predicted CoA-binding protein